MPFLVCLFTLLIVAFAIQKLFSLIPFVYFAFVAWAFGVISKKWLPRPMSRKFSPYFLLGVLQFQNWYLRLNPFWVDLCIWCKEKVHFHSLAYGYPVFPIPLLKDYPFSIVYSWFLCYKLIIHVCVDLVLSPLICAIFLCVCLYANTILFLLLHLCSTDWNL